MTDTPLNVAVLMGGPSAEAEVSRNSAAQIAAALTTSGHMVTRVELDSGCAAQLLGLAPDVVFPALHGPPGEDGTVQGFLEILDLPYVGSGVRGSAMAMDKAVAKAVFRAHGLPVLADVVVSRDASGAVTPSVQVVRDAVGERVAIKPLNQGSAIGVQLLPNGGDLEPALQAALTHGPCLVEPFLTGLEITVGILETDSELIPHPVIEIVTGDGQWYDYTNRYTPGHSEHVIPARVSPEVASGLQDTAAAVHRILGLRDLSRSDFIVTDLGEVALLEVNTLPGMTPTSLYPDGARHIGYPFPALMDYLVRRAVARARV